MSASGLDNCGCRILCPRRTSTPSCSRDRSRPLKTLPGCVLGRPSPCSVPQGYASVAELPAALPESVLSRLSRILMTTDPLQQSLNNHLDSWGLKRFTSDAEYFAWQREAVSPDQLASLHQCIELKRRGTAADEVAFYDATADPKILPVLYSQRYDYYHTIGPRVAARIHDARTVLDFGCGV